MEKFFNVIFILSLPSALMAFECMPAISSNICIQTGYDPSIPDPNTKPPLVVNTTVEIVVSIFS
jgi:hypothetical protein